LHEETLARSSSNVCNGAHGQRMDVCDIIGRSTLWTGGDGFSENFADPRHGRVAGVYGIMGGSYIRIGRDRPRMSVVVLMGSAWMFAIS